MPTHRPPDIPFTISVNENARIGLQITPSGNTLPDPSEGPFTIAPGESVDLMAGDHSSFDVRPAES